MIDLLSRQRWAPDSKDIHLQSSQNTRKQDKHHSGSSGSIGVGFAFGGAQNGFTLELAAAGNKGKAKGTGTTHHATDITAGNTLNLTSGRDTTLRGAQAKEKTINAHIGRNLTLTSTQDNNHYTEKDQSAGAGLSLCIPPFCYGTSGGSASYSQNNIRNTYQSVTDQTGLAAGKGGYNIHVGHTTTLTGAAIASQATPDKNQLNTGNLKLNSLRNIAISSANKTGASFNTSGTLGSNLTQNAKGATLNLAIPQNGTQISETESRIAKGTIQVRNHPNQDLSGINRDATTLDGNGVTNDFDLDQIKENQELGQAAGYVGMRVAGDIAQYQQRQAVNDLIKAKGKNDKAAEAAANTKLANWGDGGKYATALHGMIGAATAAIGGGNAAQGAMGAVASEAASGVMQDYLKTHDIKPNSATGNTLMNLASTAIGATAGNGNGAAIALYGDKYNRQLHTEEIDWINTYAEAFARQQCNGCDPSAQQVHETKAELTQQALRDVDLLWRIHVPEGDNSKQAQHFLETAQGSFTNAIGEQQQLFTTEGNQFIRPLLLAEQAEPDTIAFYENYAQPGATRNFSSGFKTEAGQPIGEGAKALGHDMQHLAWWGQAGKALLEDVGHTLVHPIETFDSAKHFALQSGETLKESQHIDAKSQQLNALYGQDVSDDAKFLQHVALGGNLGQIYLTGKGGGITGKVTVGTGKAGAKYLAQTEMGQAVTRATGKAAEQTGKLVKENRKEITICGLGLWACFLQKDPDEMPKHEETVQKVWSATRNQREIDSQKITLPIEN